MTDKLPRGRPRLTDGPDLKILNCKVPLDIKLRFVERAKEHGFKTASAMLRKLVIDELKKVVK